VVTWKRVTTIAGTGRWRWTPDHTPEGAAVFLAPWRVAISPRGDLFLADFKRNRIYRIDANDANKDVYQIAGSDWVGYQGEGTPARDYGVWGPIGLAWGADGGLIFSEATGAASARLPRMVSCARWPATVGWDIPEMAAGPLKPL
jgi:hypothetical protein